MTPLVLLPGMNCTADLWTGCGVDDARTPELTEDDLGRQVERLLDELPPVFAIGGLSLGGIVAMALAVRAPERVSGLFVASTNAKAPTDAQRASWRRWLARLDAGDAPRDLQAEILGALLGPGVVARRPDLVERTLRMGAETAPGALAMQLHLQGTRVDLREGLRRVRVPTLVLSASDDVLCPPAFHEEILAAVADGIPVSVDAGHLSPVERPDEVGAAVRAWWSAVSRGPRAARADDA
ncbi:alpha/beta fold hydrolase [Microbacterium oleivorans]|uniref:Alpha/beta fold hydrolase n=1 Tax=Microbacterium oleivorans TaxID=273677 RepID=A0A7D5EW63_9MICO|nr:alpha/beta fold hydrolase [Microbacterium oleivorans]QLD11831.1 alpha/beta fold hydrolase [Microbacterium oleivorans]